MALKDNELFSSVAGRGAEIRLFPREEGGLKVGTIAAQSGAPTLLKGLALAYDRDVDLWTVYTQPSDQAIYTITDQAGATDGGTFALMIDGLASVHASKRLEIAPSNRTEYPLKRSRMPHKAR